MSGSKKKVIIVGAGIAGMSASAILAKEGYDVTIIEKNDKPGGRINSFSSDGFTFDMGPSWYWMPDVFESFYKLFGHTASDFYDLVRLDPSYKVVFKNSQEINIPASYTELLDLFESIEPGAAKKLTTFLEHAQYKYEVGMNEFVWKPGRSIFEFLDIRVFKSVFKLQMFSSVAKEVESLFKDDRLRQILKFPVLFLGATPEDTPALYSLMNYADLKLGTWYPKGGMYEIAKAFKRISDELGVTYRFDEPVTDFAYRDDGSISSVKTASGEYKADIIIANADYNHVETSLLKQSLQSYSPKYWNSRKLAPSSLLVYLGVNKKLKNLEHHNLFFDADFKEHAAQIYKKPAWPDNPLFYVCCPSVSDSSVAPLGCENLFLLMPIAPDLSDSTEMNNKYLDMMLKRLEDHIGQSVTPNIVYKKFFSVDSFKEVYNSFKGNAYGLANTLSQTAILKPSLKSKKISNLYFSGQLTTPGPGLPPAIISGQVVAAEIIKQAN